MDDPVNEDAKIEFSEAVQNLVLALGLTKERVVIRLQQTPCSEAIRLMDMRPGGYAASNAAHRMSFPWYSTTARGMRYFCWPRARKPQTKVPRLMTPCYIHAQRSSPFAERAATGDQSRGRGSGVASRSLAETRKRIILRVLQ